MQGSSRSVGGLMPPGVVIGCVGPTNTACGDRQRNGSAEWCTVRKEHGEPMNNRVMCTGRHSPSMIATAVAVATVISGCGQRWLPATEERVPDIIPIAGSPDVQRYRDEFSTSATREAGVAPDREEPATPADCSMIKGRVFATDHSTNCQLWVIQSYVGSNWQHEQKVYIYSNEKKALREVSAFADRVIGEAFVLSREGCSEPFLMATVSESAEYRPWNDELWTCDLRTERLQRISTGRLPSVSPARSAVSFWKVDRTGFHCLYVWDLQAGRIEPVLSMWESDPGSGPGWTCRWSEDSR